MQSGTPTFRSSGGIRGGRLTASWSLWSGAFRDLSRPEANRPFLDVLRSIAVLLVFTAHFPEVFHSFKSVGHLPVVWFGWTGVEPSKKQTVQRAMDFVQPRIVYDQGDGPAGLIREPTEARRACKKRT